MLPFCVIVFYWIKEKYGGEGKKVKHISRCRKFYFVKNLKIIKIELKSCYRDDELNFSESW